jgi:hypothetical protein
MSSLLEALAQASADCLYARARSNGFLYDDELKLATQWESLHRPNAFAQAGQHAASSYTMTFRTSGDTPRDALARILPPELREAYDAGQLVLWYSGLAPKNTFEITLRFGDRRDALLQERVDRERAALRLQRQRDEADEAGKAQEATFVAEAARLLRQ